MLYTNVNYISYSNNNLEWHVKDFKFYPKVLLLSLGLFCGAFWLIAHVVDIHLPSGEELYNDFERGSKLDRQIEAAHKERVSEQEANEKGLEENLKEDRKNLEDAKNGIEPYYFN